MRRSGIKIMAGLIRLLSPLAHVMLACISLGVLGYLCAIFITVLAAHLLLVLTGESPWKISFGATIALMLVIALARAVLRYGEQTCGHYIAFRCRPAQAGAGQAGGERTRGFDRSDHRRY